MNQVLAKHMDKSQNPIKTWISVNLVLDTFYMFLLTLCIPYMMENTTIDEFPQSKVYRSALKLQNILYISWLVPG